jgi:hypothetical protein
MARSMGRTDGHIISRRENSPTTTPFAVYSIIVEKRLTPETRYVLNAEIVQVKLQAPAHHPEVSGSAWLVSNSCVALPEISNSVGPCQILSEQTSFLSLKRVFLFRFLSCSFFPALTTKARS